MFLWNINISNIYIVNQITNIYKTYIYILFDFFDFWIAITLKKNISGKFDSDM